MENEKEKKRTLPLKVYEIEMELRNQFELLKQCSPGNDTSIIKDIEKKVEILKKMKETKILKPKGF